jgi:hypothetical protein
VDFARRAQRAPRTRTEGPRFAFASPPPRGVAGEPGHWCAADVIGYRIDFDAALLAGSTRAREKYRWRRAAAEWTRASGGRYRLEYRGPARYPVVDGAAGHSPVDLSRVPAGEIALTYAVGSDRTGPGFRRYTHAALSTALGVGGVEQVTWDSATPGQIQRGMVILDAVDTANDPLDVPTPYVHELGHALGLGHVADRRQIMATHAGPQAQIGGGDIAGITRLASAGC